jgi:hypothetical protein
MHTLIIFQLESEMQHVERNNVKNYPITLKTNLDEKPLFSLISKNKGFIYS